METWRTRMRGSAGNSSLGLLGTPYECSTADVSLEEPDRDWWSRIFVMRERQFVIGGRGTCNCCLRACPKISAKRSPRVTVIGVFTLSGSYKQRMRFGFRMCMCAVFRRPSTTYGGAEDACKFQDRQPCTHGTVGPKKCRYTFKFQPTYI